MFPNRTKLANAKQAMPQIIKKQIEYPGPGRPSKIDWDGLEVGKNYRLTSGDDFEGDPNTVQSSAHQAAKRRGLKAKTKVEDGNVIVQFFAE